MMIRFFFILLISNIMILFSNAQEISDTELYDLKKSYLSWETKDKSFGKWDIESLVFVYDENNKIIDYLIGIGPVMAAKVYGNGPLFYSPEFKYKAVFGKKNVKIFRSHVPYLGNDSYDKIDERFNKIDLFLTKIDSNKVREIDNNCLNTIIDNKTLLIKLEFSYMKNKYVVFCNSKHVNYHKKNNLFQVETGPIVVPDFSKNFNDNYVLNSTFSYIALNNFENIDFLNYEFDKKLGIIHYCGHYNFNSNIKIYIY